ncbi:hypothetical protein [Segetibacter koreensis]|uniref:hypothetical protein n=1 Tax=Segetibacter koreensis TaxID=398037 RepID=UPI00039F5AD5|nr:hypothetical protein [Segetibacter koreensis]
MSLRMIKTSAKTSKWIIYLILIIIGVIIILLCSIIQNVSVPVKGEYYYSSFLRNNYTLLSNVYFFITGFLLGYYYKLNPWYCGICLFLIFPLTSIIEGVVFKGSHNLIPFEFVFHFLMALPTVIAVYIGRFVNRKVAKRKVQDV